MQRRTLLAALPAVAWPGVRASTYPEQPLRVVVPYAAGSATDLLARAVAKRLGAALGQPAYVENRPGAGGTIGTAAAAKAPADGYTLLMTGTPHVVNPWLYAQPGYDPLRDFVPLGTLSQSASVLAVPAASAARDVRGLMELGRAARDGLSYASGGNGTPAHLGGHALAKLGGFNGVHVPYKGASEIVNALAGQTVEYGLPVMALAMTLIRSGRIRALAVTSAQRQPQLADVPTLQESIPGGFVLSAWSMLLAPAATPAGAVQRLSAALQAIVNHADYSQQLAADGAQAFWQGDGPALTRFLQTESAQWKQWVHDSGVRVG